MMGQFEEEKAHLDKTDKTENTDFDFEIVSFVKICCQALNHPWMGLLLTEGETSGKYSRCAATMVRQIISSLFPKLFSDWQQHLSDGGPLSGKLGWGGSDAFAAQNNSWHTE